MSFSLRSGFSVAELPALPAITTAYTDSHMFEADRHKVAGGQAIVFSSRCPDRDDSNEDAAAVISLGPETAVLAVADGVGGGRHGGHAARVVIAALIEAVNEYAETYGDGTSDDQPALRTAILDGIEAANARVLEMSVGPASTLAVAEVRGGMIRPYHVGDSMILVVGQRGRVKLQTVSHSPVGFAVESGLLDEADAIYHADRHVVSNVVGTPEMRMEIGSPLPLAPRDTLLLASDGLFDNLHMEEIIQRIRKGSLDEAVAQLAEDAADRMQHPAENAPSKPDDLTLIAFRRKSA